MSELAKSKDVGTIRRSSSKYPPLLSSIADCPDPLYYLGDYKEELFKNTLAVVGSRAVTMYGEWVVNTIVKEVARYGVTIVSGFMYGVDALAHKVALEADGTTIAVMAGGVDKVFPAYQEQLYLDIVERGLVVSEFHGNCSGGGWMFAKRNRIVAGLSYAVLVVEAAEASGSLITANYARQYGRQLLTVPANLNAKNAFGTTQLLRDGAKMVTCADDILELYFGTPNSFHKRDVPSPRKLSAVNKRLLLDVSDATMQNILELLYSEPLSADELSLKLGIPSSESLKCLTGLSLIGQICEKGGMYYASQS
jgi:DNA processing protein